MTDRADTPPRRHVSPPRGAPAGDGRRPPVAVQRRNAGRRRARVLIAGGGVAGLETLLALRALAGDRVDIAVLSPEPWFVNRSMSVAQPFKAKRSRGLAMQRVTAELGAAWHRGAVGRVEPERHCVVTKAGQELRYDRLVLAIGAHSAREWEAPGVLTYHGGEDSPGYRLLLRRLQDGGPAAERRSSSRRGRAGRCCSTTSR